MDNVAVIFVNKMIKKMLLFCRFSFSMFTRTAYIVVPYYAEIVGSLTSLLFSAMVKNKEVNESFFITIKMMIYFVSFTCHYTGKCVSLNNIYTDFTTRFFTTSF